MAEQNGGASRSHEIGLAELVALARRSWRLIVVCAVLAGVVAKLAQVFLVPTVYKASAKLLITPLAQGYAEGATDATLYRLLATSDGLVADLLSQLQADGVLGEEALLRVDQELEAQGAQAGRDGRPAFLELAARNGDPQVAATIVNTWAGIVVKEGRSLFHGTASGSEALLGAQLEPTNAELVAAGEELSQLLDELGKRVEETTISWDQRIAAAKRRAEQAMASYNTATRRQLEEAAGLISPPSSPSPVVGGEVRAQLQKIVSVRAQLARTPRVLTLEKAASDESLVELLAAGRPVNQLDVTLVTEERNPLYDQLTLNVLQLESDFKSADGLAPAEAASVLAELERIQLERETGLMALEGESDLELRVLQLRRGRALEELSVEERRIRSDNERKVDQLTGLARELSGQLNRSVVSRVLDDVELIRLAVPAFAPTLPIAQQKLLQLAAAIFLGGLLGLMIGLFRSGAESR